MESESHLHAVSLSLFCKAFYFQSLSHDLLASPSLKAEKLSFSIFINDLKTKTRATDS